MTMKAMRVTWMAMLALAAGCQRGPTDAARASSKESAATAASPAQLDLDPMDTRLPVPLLPMMASHQKQNMRDHLLAVQEITLALATDDFAAVERASGRIGYSEQMGQMCTHMGMGAPGFTEQALKFHHTADTIGEAARRRDRAAVMAALGATLQTCTSCHATFRQVVVDEPTWKRMTGSASIPVHQEGQHQ
ncbi:MAG: cytochrome c [Acidobacteriota bacterium]